MDCNESESSRNDTETIIQIKDEHAYNDNPVGLSRTSPSIIIKREPEDNPDLIQQQLINLIDTGTTNDAMNDGTVFIVAVNDDFASGDDITQLIMQQEGTDMECDSTNISSGQVTVKNDHVMMLDESYYITSSGDIEGINQQPDEMDSSSGVEDHTCKAEGGMYRIF